MILPVRIEDIAVYNDNLYFFSQDFNALCCIEKGNISIRKLCDIPDEDFTKERLYVTMIYFDEKLCLIPFIANELAIYDIKENNVTKIAVDEDISNQKYKFMAARLVGENIYMFGLYVPSIYCFNTKDCTYKKVCDMDKETINNLVFDKSDAYFRQQTEYTDGRIYVPFCNANAMLIYDVINNECNIKKLGDEENGYSGIVNDGNILYCSPRKADMRGIKWNLNNGKIEYLKGFSAITLGIYIKNGEYEYCNLSDILFVKNEENKQITYDAANQLIICEDDDIKEFSMEMEISMEYMNKFKEKKYYIENSFIGLEKFIYMILDKYY